MAGEEITVVQTCRKCHSETGTFTVKKENLMLASKELIWCRKCEAYTPEIRDVAGRRASIQKETETYPRD